MSNPSSNQDYFWQGGRRIPIERTEGEITLHVPDTGTARSVAAEAGVDLEGFDRVSPDLVRATVRGDRDAAIDRLRESDTVVHHVYRTPGQTDSEYLITDTFFIKFKPDVTPEAIEQYLSQENLEVVQNLGNQTLLVRVTAATGRNPIKTANRAANRDDVEYAEPNLVHRLQRFAYIPTDTLFPQQWHLHAPADVAPNLVTGAGIFAPEAWEITLGSRDIVICVADDGFDLTHPDFQGPNKIAGRLNAFESNGTVFFTEDVLPKPGGYHGTPCAGVALAESNGQGTVGVAPGCAFLAVRFPLNFDDAAMIQLFQRISREADVVSCSWGYGPANVPLSRAFSEAITTLVRTGGRRGKGLVICVAAGNNNCPVKDLSNTKTYEFWFGNTKQSYSGPIDRWIAAHPDVITVSGCTSLKTRSCYSSWGKEICVCAPTDNWDDMRQITPKGRGVVTTDNEGAGAGTDFTPGSRYTNRFGGTSSATPTVAGVCGLILSRNPNLTALEVKQILTDTADQDLKIESETAVNVPGHFVAGFSPWYGHGKVNAFKAVKAAISDHEITIDQEVKPALIIPDAGAAVTSKIEVTQRGVIQDIRISIDLTHTYIGDLRVDITAPDGTSVVLHDHTGNSTDDIRKVYAASELPALRALIGKPIQGNWILHVVDTWRMDVGKLNAWRLVAKANTAG
jgi:subtilisin-like proprotein convertase family protein